MSGVPGSATKKRKKTDAKPQSQINKCLNEKRRREQENIYIEELAELISASFADMNSLSVKPDKCAILQETVNQIRHIKEQENNNCSNIGAAATTTVGTASPCASVGGGCVGGGGGNSVGSDAAVQQGEVSSSNPTVLRNEVFGPLLLEALDGFLFVVNVEGRIEFVTENVHQFIQFTRDDVLGKSIYNFIHVGDHARFSSSLLPISIGWSNDQNPPNSRRTFTCRLLVKPPDEQDATMEEKQQRQSSYENMQIQTSQINLNKDKGDLDDVSSESSAEMGGLSLLCVARRIPQNEKSVGTPIEQFSMKLDTSGKIIGIDTFGVSAVYSQYLNKDLMGQIVQEMCHPEDLAKLSAHLKDAISVGTATSPIYRLRVAATPIAKYLHVRTVSKLFKGMSREPDFIMATHSIIGENDLPPAELQPSPTPSNLGGPMMGGGAPPHVTSPTTSNFNTNYDLSMGDFDSFLTSNQWEETSVVQSATPADSRSSLTPRPPSVPVYSPAPAHAFPFSPLGNENNRSDTAEQQQGNGNESGIATEESGRLRGLLLRRGSTGDEGEGRHRILKGLLNQEEEEAEGGSGKGAAKPAATSGNNNIMLLKLLNEKSDDDDLESRAGLKKQNELLQQLLKEQGDERKSSNTMNSHQEDTLLRSLGFRPTPTTSPPTPTSTSPSSNSSTRKRHNSDESPAHVSPKRPSPSTPTPTDNKLWEKNKMLASLLAKEPPKASIPPIPTSVISATPQDKLPRIDRAKAANLGAWPQTPRPTGKPPPPRGANPSPYNMPDQLLMPPKPPPSHQWESSSDPILSDILDQVIDIVPETVCSDSTQIMNLLDQMDQEAMSERMAISAIQKSLMLCENAMPSNYQQHPQTQSPAYPPPPLYSQHPQPPPATRSPLTRFPPAGGRNPAASFTHQQQQIIVQQRKIMAEQQKQRLLQAQQQQQLLIPSNATAASEQTGATGLEGLLNSGVVAPNVTLQRSQTTPDAQLSPGYPGQLLTNGNVVPIASPRPQQQQQQQQQTGQPYSPHSPQATGWGRLSPHHTQGQLSPRITQGQQTGYTVTSQQQTSNWQQPNNNRLNMQQQQNPMLNAQLGGSYSSNLPRYPLTPPQRNPQPPRPPQATVYSTDGGGVGGFPPSPSAYATATTGNFPRMQRNQVQLPGGLLSPRHYGALSKDLPPPHLPPYPSPPADMPQYNHHHHPPHHHQQMLYNLPPSHPPPSPAPTNLHPYEYDMSYGARLQAPPPPAEYVRQELRAVVGARTQQQNATANAAPNGGTATSGGLQASTSPHIQQVPPADLEALGLTFEMPSGPSDSPKIWGTMGADLGAGSPQPGISTRSTTMEESTQRMGDHKSSLLQKLLSE